MASLLNSTRSLKKNSNHLQTLPEKGTLLNIFYEASITLIPKPAKDISRKPQTNIP